MSVLRVTKITNKDDDGAVEFTRGAILPAGTNIVNENGADVIEISSSGIVTATSFQGDGSALTGIEGTPKGKLIGFVLIT